MDRARAERQAALSGSAAPQRQDKIATVSRLEPAQPKPPATDVKVDYTRTATVRIDADELRERRIFLSDGLDPVTDAYKVLRTHVLQRMRANGWRTLAVTSPGVGEGKTITSINLAISLAREVNQTVLLVDLDLRRPSIGRYFSEGPTLGISDYLTHGTDLADMLINPGVDRLVILPGHDSFTHSSEMLSSPRVVQLVSELKGRYEDRLILFDMPPLFAGDDVIAFLPYVDAVMLVVEDGKVSKAELEQADHLLSQNNLIGMVLNKAEPLGEPAGYY
ncbi:hypothetical protein D779_2324 [Imhoffiella purpurea]|uniref:AAA domain-containing protein n=2 Tax=Imhoffiella purpurea TaxID=1249627 RepID=W9VVY5_9GAMM|nr:hypothetical protein D779_2324 [Imhoffiella purpurea]